MRSNLYRPNAASVYADFTGQTTNTEPRAGRAISRGFPVPFSLLVPLFAIRTGEHFRRNGTERGEIHAAPW